MKKLNVLGIGELLWDIFNDSRKPGGAPANVAFHLNQLGMNGIIASRIGEDSLGEEIQKFLMEMGISVSFLQHDSNHPTGTVTVELDQSGTPAFRIHENAAWDFLEMTSELQELLPSLSAVCFGTLAQRENVSRRTIQTLLELLPRECLKVYDVNLRQNFFSRELLEILLSKSDIAKMNHEEVEILKPLLGIPLNASLTECAEILCDRFRLKKVCVTRAENGCRIVTHSGEIADVPGKNIQVADTVGSGDSFTAALIYAELKNCGLQIQAEFANAVGTLVASYPGGMPPLRDELTQLKTQFGI